MISDMARLGINQYGKAETHLVRVMRDGEVHGLRDLLVSVALSGSLEAVHVAGDNSAVIATDTQKNTVYAFAKEHGVGTPEEFAGRLARHFVGGAITRARVEVREVEWARLGDRAFVQSDRAVRVAVVVAEADRVWTVSGVSGLVVLKTSDSEFHGFPRDRYTTLAETDDRVLATEVSARWRHDGSAVFADGTRCWRASPPITRGRCSRRCTRWGRPCSTRAPGWRRSGCRCRTSTTSSWTWRRSGSPARTRSSTRTIGRTG
jgi:urate oxidase